MLAKVSEMADERNVATNVMCAEIITYFIEKGLEFKPEKIVEQKEVLRILCPTCLKHFADVKSLVDHFTANKSCLQGLKRIISMVPQKQEEVRPNE